MIKWIVGVALIATLAGFTYKEGQRFQPVEKRLGQVASAIAKRPVKVRCQGMVKDAVDVSDAHGTVEFSEQGRPADVAKLRRGLCAAVEDFPKKAADLERFRCLFDGSDCPEGVVKVVDAVHTAAHESWHLAGIRDERITECYALQTTAWWAVNLGAGEPLARAMANYAALVMYPKLSQDYQSGECRDGGKYDLNRASRSWPT